jgi:hypothetical protein
MLLTPETMNERNADGMTALHITARGGFDDYVLLRFFFRLEWTLQSVITKIG